MAINVVMPALEMAQETGKLIAWRKREGEAVSKGEILLEIETDKAVMEIPAEADGILTGVTASEGAVVPVGQTIAWLVGAGESPPPEPIGAVASKAATPAAPAPTWDKGGHESRPGSVKASPKARRAARELGVDIAQVQASSPV